MGLLERLAGPAIIHRCATGCLLAAVLLLLAGCGQTPSRWDPGYYTVKRGDTLYSIAHAYRLDFRVLARWNGIRPPYTIYPGQRLTLRSSGRPPQSRSTASSGSSSSRQKAASPSPAPRSGDLSQEKQYADIRWKWPTRGKLITTYEKGDPARKGIDIEGRYGQKVHAAAAGKVVYSGSGLVGYGRLIIIKHNPAYLSAYGHNRKLLVAEGDRVDLGDVIAEMGRADADTAMLHFEIRRDGNPVDPQRFLP